MNAVNSGKMIPKFLRVSKDIDKILNINKFLIFPLVPGEVVKVAPLEEQVPDNSSATKLDDFRKKFVVIYRKGGDGSWSVKNTFLRSYFNELKK
mgnify:CR=1 FL=1|jgi:hypothetical protein